MRAAGKRVESSPLPGRIVGLPCSIRVAATSVCTLQAVHVMHIVRLRRHAVPGIHREATGR